MFTFVSKSTITCNAFINFGVTTKLINNDEQKKTEIDPYNIFFLMEDGLITPKEIKYCSIPYCKNRLTEAIIIKDYINEVLKNQPYAKFNGEIYFSYSESDCVDKVQVINNVVITCIYTLICGENGKRNF